MSHPEPTRDYGDSGHPEDSKTAHGRALKKKKTPRAGDTVKGWAKHLRKVIRDNK